MNDFSHTVTAEATKNIVPLCINRQMNNVILQNYSITFKSWTADKKWTELNWTELNWAAVSEPELKPSSWFVWI